MSGKRKGVWLTLLAAACFGAAPLIAKFMYQYDVAVSSVLAWRFLIASILLWAYIFLFRKDLKIRLRKDQLIMMIVIGGVAHFLTTQLYFSALLYVPIGVQIMIFYTYPFMVNILGVVLFKERAGKVQTIALVLAFVGILLTLTLDDFRMNLIGIVLCFGAAISNAVYLLCLGRKAVMELDSFVIGAYSTVFAGISFFIFSLSRGELTIDLPLPCWLGIGALAVFTTSIGAIALSMGIKYIGSAKAAIISVFEPIEAIVLGALIFHEVLTGRRVFGIILVLGAIMLINLAVAKKSTNANIAVCEGEAMETASLSETETE